MSRTGSLVSAVPVTTGLGRQTTRAAMKAGRTKERRMVPGLGLVGFFGGWVFGLATEVLLVMHNSMVLVEEMEERRESIMKECECDDASGGR